MTNSFDDSVYVIRRDPQVRVEVNEVLERFNKLSYIYQSKTGYDSLIQNVILKELINILGTAITDLDIDLKMKSNRIEYLESNTNSQIFKKNVVTNCIQSLV